GPLNPALPLYRVKICPAVFRVARLNKCADQPVVGATAITEAPSSGVRLANQEAASPASWPGVFSGDDKNAYYPEGGSEEDILEWHGPLVEGIDFLLIGHARSRVGLL
ncbi:unnamed protein product, partial [Protopolystoma xenopodis]